MAGLVLKLAPKERVLINGAVIENGDRGGAPLHRHARRKYPTAAGCDPSDRPTSGSRRACYALQLVLSGDCDPGEAKQALLRRIEELSQVFTDHDSRSALAEATDALIGAHHYRCLKALRALLPREDRVLALRHQ